MFGCCRNFYDTNVLHNYLVIPAFLANRDSYPILFSHFASVGLVDNSEGQNKDERTLGKPAAQSKTAYAISCLFGRLPRQLCNRPTFGSEADRHRANYSPRRLHRRLCYLPLY